MEPQIQLDPLLVLLPIFILGTLIGYRRGLVREAYTLIALLVAMLFMAGGTNALVSAINYLIPRIGRVFATFAGTQPRENLPTLQLNSTVVSLFDLMVLCLLFIIAYRVANNLGKANKPDGSSRLWGAVLGGVNLAVVLGRFIAWFNGRQLPRFQGGTIMVPSPLDALTTLSWSGSTVVLAVTVLITVLLALELVRSAKV